MMLNRINRCTWFVYVKFYVGKGGRIRPLVVGKSGSMRVNASGSDVNFSTAVTDGNARVFLHENGHSWYHDYILIKKFYREADAYAFETKIMNRFNMHGS
jgi:hypothetical protein